MQADPLDAVLRCDHLVRLYETDAGPVQAVRGIDLELAPGVTAAIVGPSGSGKSSLLRMLAGLDRPTAGSVLLEGVDLWALSERARTRARARVVTHVRQRPEENLHAHLTTLQQLRRVARPSGDDTPASVVDRWLDELGLADVRDRTPTTLSGGQRQRLAFARAAVAGHRVVIADEPTASLDGASTADLMTAVRRLRDGGTTVVIATHDPRALASVDHVVTLRDGAVASVTGADGELAVIDRSGRLQLPPEVRARFAERRARLTWDPVRDRLVVERP